MRIPPSPTGDAELRRWLEANLTPGAARHLAEHRAEIEAAIEALGVDPASELADFHRHYGPGAVRGWYALLEADAIRETTAFAHAELGVPANFLALTGIEGAGITLLDTNSGAVFDVELGQFERLAAGTLAPAAGSFGGFLQQCKDNDDARSGARPASPRTGRPPPTPGSDAVKLQRGVLWVLTLASAGLGAAVGWDRLDRRDDPGEGILMAACLALCLWGLSSARRFAEGNERARRPLLAYWALQVPALSSPFLAFALALGPHATASLQVAPAVLGGNAGLLGTLEVALMPAGAPWGIGLNVVALAVVAWLAWLRVRA